MTNVDPKTGIHYGAIHQNSLSGDAASDIYDNAEDLTHKAAVSDAKEGIRNAISYYVRDSRLDELIESFWSDVEDDFNDSYECQDADIRYERDGYTIVNALDSDFMILGSPYFTYARPCSPCVPNAGDLDTPDPDGLKTYCLGHDFFEKWLSGSRRAPYSVFDVATGARVFAEGQEPNLTGAAVDPAAI